MAAAAACRAPVVLASTHRGGRPWPTQRTCPGPQRTCHRRSKLQCQAAASTAQEGVTAWLAGAGVDVAKQAVAPSGSGLVTSRPVNKGEQLFAIPESAWITPLTAAQSEIGQYLAGWVACYSGKALSTSLRACLIAALAYATHLQSGTHSRGAVSILMRGDAASLRQHATTLLGRVAGMEPAPTWPCCPPWGRRLEPWLAIALFLLHERSKGAASRWSAYLAALPADSGSPVQWGEEDLAELAGSQLLGTVQGYRWVGAASATLCPHR